MVQMTFPGSQQVIIAIEQFEVKDCTCNNRGACDDKGRCVCRLGSAGQFCEACQQGFLGPNCDCQNGVTCKSGGHCNAAGKCCCSIRFAIGSNCDRCASGRFGPECRQYDATVKKIVQTKYNIQPQTRPPKFQNAHEAISWLIWFIWGGPQRSVDTQIQEKIPEYDSQEMCPA
eukprot:TRINITY_DN6645_c0_g1_i11.p2 TRINITY_DN6645_c0_g1~~TRINITY_DN6645_c0_g1_i11.p2  ORF type:complete len:173 (-),score=32.75 TRINITY_DN6645_c0_g1_i11:98-616(-)